MVAFCEVGCGCSCVNGCRNVAVDKRDARRCSEDASNVVPRVSFSLLSRECCRLG
jgi:hypothetical protein